MKSAIDRSSSTTRIRIGWLNARSYGILCGAFGDWRALGARTKQAKREPLGELLTTMKRSAARPKDAGQAELTESFGKARAALKSAASDIASLRARVTSSRRRAG